MERFFWLVRLFVAALFLFYSSSDAHAEKRVAFIVGNGAYDHAPSLDNPVNDATAMSQKLKQMGFLTVEGLDLNHSDFESRIRDFAKLSSDADVVAFFYAGHGIAVDGVNYLIPVDAKFEDETALDFEAISVDFVAKMMRRAGGVSLLFLDACRNNPLAGTLSRSMGQSARSTVSSGLAEMKLEDPGKGLAIAFATSPGEIALDGTGNHSPFTAALLSHIDAQNIDFTEVMSRVTGQVYEETGQSQRPWLNTSLTGPVVLNPIAQVSLSSQDTTGAAVGGTAIHSLETEKLVFDMARESGRISDYKAFLTTFPNGVFAAFARNEILILEQQLVDQSMAALKTTETSEDVQIRSVNPGALLPSPEILVLPANEVTQNAMGMDWKMRREIQARLNLAGHDVGRPDGAFGPKTQRGILAWQTDWGFSPTGYFNQQQYVFLVTETRDSYTTWAINNPVSQPKKKAPPKKPTPRKSQNDNGVGAFLGGVAAGILLSR